ncbi:MAG: DedA family protein [archaeon]
MDFNSLMLSLGPLGIVIVMFLESSILPIPSEFVFIAAGALAGQLGLSYWEIALYGSIGSALGGAVGYFLGVHGARPLLHKWGKYILLTPARLDKAENFARKHGLFGVLVGRLTPIVPFKVFSIASGIVKLPFWGFFILTLVGTFPRAYLLSAFGSAVGKYFIETLFAALLLVATYVFFVKWRSGRRKKRDANFEKEIGMLREEIVS